VRSALAGPRASEVSVRNAPSPAPDLVARSSITGGNGSVPTSRVVHVDDHRDLRVLQIAFPRAPALRTRDYSSSSFEQSSRGASPRRAQGRDYQPDRSYPSASGRIPRTRPQLRTRTEPRPLPAKRRHPTTATQPPPPNHRHPTTATQPPPPNHRSTSAAWDRPRIPPTSAQRSQTQLRASDGTPLAHVAPAKNTPSSTNTQSIQPVRSSQVNQLIRTPKPF
jgi:hypothetical protein